MKINKFNKISILFILMLSAVSCSEDFFEPDSISTFDLEYVYSNEDDARNGVNAIYSYFNQDAFRSRLSNNMTGNTDIEHQSGWSSSSDRYQIWDLEALASNRDLEIVWTYAYRAIRDANIAIEGINSSGFLESSDVNLKNKFSNFLGEAHTLRAYWYSILAYYFGDVPYVTSAPVAGADFLLPRTNRNTILSGEIQAMIDVEENMLWADQVQFGIEQVNREYTLGMIARLALQRGGYYLKPDLTMARDGDYLEYYAIAKQYTKKLMDLKDRALPRDYRQVFLNQAKFVKPTNSDVLFEVPFSLNSGDVGWNIGVEVIGGDQASHNYGSGNNYMEIPPTYYLSFDSADIRRDVTCALYRYNEDFEQEFIYVPDHPFRPGSPTNIAQGKWSRAFLETPQGQSSAKSTGINWPMMRYSDILLMYAEAENELNGPTAEAQNALKRVRQRAFDEGDWATKVDLYVSQASSSKQTFFDAIVDERAWEFGGEMIRKYELIRWGIYSEKMQETVDGLKQLADMAFSGVGNIPDYIYWKRDESGNFQLLNPDFKVSAAPDDSWIRAPFLIDLHDDTLTYEEWITRDWANYYNGPKPGTVRYIFPTPTIAIEGSQGTLKNDGYGF